MLGLGALGQFPLGGGPFGTATVTTIGWYAPLTDPVRFKRAPRAAVAVNNQTLAFNPLPIVSFGWFDNLSDPVRIKPGLRPEMQSVLAYHPFPVINISWFGNLSEPVRLPKRLRTGANPDFFYGTLKPDVNFSYYGWLSEPVRKKPGLRSDLQQFYTSDTDVIPISKLIQWFAPLSDPVRIKPGLKAALQQFLAAPSRLIPTPATSGILDALETKDTFLAGAMLWNRATDAEIGVINTTPQPAEISLNQTAPSAGTITVRISIIIG
jgi:hypothetical protein